MSDEERPVAGAASEQTEPAPDPAVGGSTSGNALADLLLQAGHITQEQLRHAARIHGKLATPTPLLQVLKNLDYVTDEQVQSALQANRLSIPIGTLLVELGHLGHDDLETALALQREEEPKPRPIGEILIENGFIDERTFTEMLSNRLGFPFVEVSFEEIDRSLITKAPLAWYERHSFLPIRLEADSAPVVAFADPLNPEHKAAAQEVFGSEIHIAIARPGAIQSALARLGRGPTASYDENTVAGIVDSLLREAVEAGASDIHIEPMVDRIGVRFRVDGVLNPVRKVDKELGLPVSSRLKILAKADIAERRRHQDGRFVFDTGTQELDIRASFYVTVHGEAIVLRLLNNKAQLVDLNKLGMTPRVLRDFVDNVLGAPSGVVLVTGPTGSGKTTTLYSCVNHINNSDISIITAEHPVEYVVDGITQCSIDPSIDSTFEEALRHIVRQDPDVIVIGEIRDTFSAEAAIQAALTGHKVLTTFHTEDSIGGLLRLMNMDIEAFLISSTVVSVVAQRLIRRICPGCVEDYAPTSQDLRRLGYSQRDLAGARFRTGRGCEACRHTGYSGRLGVYEVLILNEAVRNAILERQTSHAIRNISIEAAGLLTLIEDGLLKASEGQTTVEEVIRVLPRLRELRPLQELRRLAGG